MTDAVHVHDADLVVEFLRTLPPEDPTDDDFLTPDDLELPLRRPISSAIPMVQRSQVEARRDFFKKRREKYEEDVSRRRALAKTRLQSRRRRSHVSFTSSLETLISERDTLLPRINRILSKHDTTEETRKKKRHQTWHAEEFVPIRDEIRSKVDELDIRDIQHRRKRLYDQYLEASNRKIGVFRDIIIEDDYDPLEARKYAVQYTRPKRTKAEDDPAVASIGSYIRRERQTTRPRGRGRARRMLEPKLWGTNIIESTPHGRYSCQNKYNPVLFRKGDRYLKNVRSNVHFDHFDYPRGNSGRRTGKRIVDRGGASRSEE